MIFDILSSGSRTISCRPRFISSTGMSRLTDASPSRLSSESWQEVAFFWSKQTVAGLLAHNTAAVVVFLVLVSVFWSQTLWIMQRLWMVFALAAAVRAAFLFSFFFLWRRRRDEKSHVARNIVAPYSRMCLLMNYHVHLARWLTIQPQLLCWCNFPAPTTTSAAAAAAHSPALYPRQLLCSSDDSPDEI